MEYSKSGKISELRRKAEETLKELDERLGGVSSTDIGQLVSELRAYQGELEMQNQELLRAQDEIETSCRRYFNMYQFAPIGCFTLDEKGLIREVNLAGANILDVDKDLLVAIPFSEYVDPRDRDIIHSHLSEVFNGRECRTCEIRLGRKDAPLTYVRLLSMAEKDSEGAPVYCRTVVVDVAEHKNAEEAEIAKEGVEAATRAKSDFLANMSHELRTPLNSIIGFSEILQDHSAGDLNERQREYVGYIHDSGMHLLRLIGEILDLSKAEAGKLNLELCQVLLIDILMAALNMQKEKAMTHGISLSLEMGTERDVEIIADPLRLKQIVFNLLSNAVKFTPDGGSVRIRSKVLSQITAGVPDEYVEISIEDTGIGIRPEDMKNLFKGFTQLNSPYADKFEGAGLGLALSKQLVELHGGRIWATSEYGKGSTFTFLIPKRGAAAP